MRLSRPREGEPIRLVTTTRGHRYRVVLDVAPAGAPRRQITRTFDTLTKAREFVTATRAGISSGSFVASRRDIRPMTVEGYRNALAPALRHLGGRKVQALTVSDIESLKSWLSREGGKHEQSLGPRSVRAALIALGQALDMAAREGTDNPQRRPARTTAMGPQAGRHRPGALAARQVDPVPPARRHRCPRGGVEAFPVRPHPRRCARTAVDGLGPSRRSRSNLSGPGRTRSRRPRGRSQE